jgi:hypothetical protein
MGKLVTEVHIMTKLLEKAFAKASRLPLRDQNALAEWLLKELESEARWEKLFAESQKGLSQLAEEAREERRRGRTKKLDPGKL